MVTIDQTRGRQPEFLAPEIRRVECQQLWSAGPSINLEYCNIHVFWPDHLVFSRSSQTKKPSRPPDNLTFPVNRSKEKLCRHRPYSIAQLFVLLWASPNMSYTWKLGWTSVFFASSWFHFHVWPFDLWIMNSPSNIYLIHHMDVFKHNTSILTNQSSFRSEGVRER